MVEIIGLYVGGFGMSLSHRFFHKHDDGNTYYTLGVLKIFGLKSARPNSEAGVKRMSVHQFQALLHRILPQSEGSEIGRFKRNGPRMANFGILGWW